MEIVERGIALKMGLKTYYTGRLCKNGHVAYRYTDSGSCADCINGKSLMMLPPGVDADSLQKHRDERAALVLNARVEQDKAMQNAKDRLAALPHVATDRYLICYDADWMTVRSVLVMETQAIYPALTPEDIAPLNGVKNFGGLVYRHTVHTTAELWQTLSDMSNAMLRARQGPAVAPTHGRLTINNLGEWLGWTSSVTKEGEFDIFPLYGMEERERTKDQDHAVKLGEFWYRPYEIIALVKGQRASVEPIGDA